MTKKLSYTRLSKSRFIGLEFFSKNCLTARELATSMWGAHKMALVNAKAVIRELLLSELISVAQGGEIPVYRITPKAGPILKNPSWICGYCSLDTTDSNKRLWAYPCLGCEAFHQACRYCKRYVLKVSGDFPDQVVKVRSCPGSVEVPKRPEKKPKKERPAKGSAGNTVLERDLFMEDSKVRG